MRRLRGLAPPLRYAAYIVGLVLIFLTAMGVGAVSSLVLGGPPERAETSSGEATDVENPAGESTGVENPAGKTTDVENLARETTDVADAEGASSFVHRATEENSRADYTYIRHPAIDGDPDAVVLASVSAGRGDDGGETYGHNIGVWYDFADRREWAIFNQDLAAVPAGATFEVVLPPDRERFVHRAKPANTADDATYLGHPLTDGKPDAVLSATQNWNPGGGVGVYSDHPVGVLYDEDSEKWAVRNLDGAPMPAGAAFNVAVPSSR
jgi:hypothetical protein